MKKTILMLLLIAMTLSCKRVLMVVMKIRQPRIESMESINSFLIKGGITSNEVYYVDSTVSYTFWYDPSVVERLPDMKIYNSNGDLIRKLGKQECSKVYGDQIAEMNLASLPVVIINAEHVASTLAKYKRIDGKKVTLQDFKQGDYIACMSYTNALGKVATNSLQTWTNSLKKNKDADKIKILYMNMDMNTTWGITSRKDSRRLKFDY